MTVVSRRLIKPYPGKTNLVMSRVKRFSDIAVEGGAKSRISKAIGGEMNGTIMLTNVYASLTEATKSFESYMQNPKMAGRMIQSDEEFWTNMRMHLFPEHEKNKWGMSEEDWNNRNKGFIKRMFS